MFGKILLLVDLVLLTLAGGQVRASSSNDFSFVSVPKMLNYQGFLTDAQGKSVNDLLVMEFMIYDDSTGGTLLWNEIQRRVSVDHGSFNVILGRNNAIPVSVFTKGKDRWLQINVSGRSLSPRTRITAVGYAYVAAYADTAGYLIGGDGDSRDEDWIIVHDDMYAGVEGNVGIGTTEPTSKLSVGGDGLIDVGIYGTGYKGVWGASPLSVTDIKTYGYLGGYEPEGYETFGVYGEYWTVSGPRSTFGYLASSSRGAYGEYDANNYGFLGGDGYGVYATGSIWAGYFVGKGYFSDNVGIGTSNPVEKLQVNGTAQMTGFKMTTGASSGHVLTSDRNGIGTWQELPVGIGGSGTTNCIPKFTSENTIGNSAIWQSGNLIGIGTMNPGKELEVYSEGDATIRLHGEAGSAIDVDLIARSVDQPNGFPGFLIKTNGANRFVIDSEGKIGIGTTTPSAQLDVMGSAKSSKFFSNLNSGNIGVQMNLSANPGGDCAPFVIWDAMNGGAAYLFGIRQESNNLLFRRYTGYWNDNLAIMTLQGGTGNVGIGTTDPDARLTIKGSATLLKGYNAAGDVVVEIGEGLDYAETFPIPKPETEPGMVVIIDDLNPGDLTISTEAYDSKVAGVVSGSKGLGSGIRLGCQETNGYAVALAGRVYCNVDAKYGDIKPGDLLTTSSTPGHAMVVKDFIRARGAILGKAMEGLSSGQKGQILMLVTLQ